ncbi:MAG: hypothetical protein K5924_08380 [Chloroflexi bacterium]|nr:hypothetical protein [Chloroflexota bacterium]
MDEIPVIVYVLWWILLIVGVVVVLPIVVYLLHRTLNAARGIEHYFARSLEAGLGIAENTANVVALEDTIKVASGILDTAAQIDEHAATIEQALGSRRAGPVS